MIPHVLTVLAGLELLSEMSELRRLGLSDDEVEGYTEFFKDNYPELKDEVHRRKPSIPEGNFDDIQGDS